MYELHLTVTVDASGRLSTSRSSTARPPTVVGTVVYFFGRPTKGMPVVPLRNEQARHRAKAVGPIIWVGVQPGVTATLGTSQQHCSTAAANSATARSPPRRPPPDPPTELDWNEMDFATDVDLQHLRTTLDELV